MNNDNPYRAPSAAVADVSENGVLELAGRMQRLRASMIDGFVLLLLIFPVEYAAGVFSPEKGQPSFATGIGITVASFVLFVLTQAYFLKRNGQTIGKKSVGIRIVDLDDNVPGLGRLLGLRYAPMYALNAIPVAGGLLGLIDTLSIFKSDRRCIHDMIAGTRVVACGPRTSSGSWFLLVILFVMVIGIGAAIVIPMVSRGVPAKPVAGAPQERPVPAGKPVVAAPPAANPGAAAPPAANPVVAAPPAANPVAAAPPAANPVAPRVDARAPVPAEKAPPTRAPSASAGVAGDPPKHAADADLRKCLELKDPAAIIRCSEQVR